MSKKYPKEFRGDVVRVALARDRDVSLAQIAQDFGIHVGTLVSSFASIVLIVVSKKA